MLDKKKILKNTTLLYFRMIITMLVSLYTSRIVLNVLGVEDYGIYNVVGGLVVMFSFLNSAMATGTQRFLSYAIGKGNQSLLSNIFSMSLNIHAIIAVVVVLLAETIGLWFLNEKMTIPVDRIVAANWVYQFSILVLVVSMLNVPNNALILANEKMNAYAYISIVEVSLKLIIVISLQWFAKDKLIVYSFLLFCVALITAIFYVVYNNKKFKEVKYHFFWDKVLFNELFGFTKWSFLGYFSSITYEQGVNILLNIFFGPAVNAVRGISFQLKSAIATFASNFQIAMNPQIVKSYALKDYEFMHSIILNGAKYSFFLLYLISLPILIETEIVLKLWLKIVPDYLVIFTRLAIINVLIDCLSNTLINGANATGDIKRFQLFTSLLFLLILPASYLFLHFGYNPQVVFVINIVVSILGLILRLILLKPLIGISISKFIKEVLISSALVTTVAAMTPLAIRISMEAGLVRFFMVLFVSVLSSLISIYFIGLQKNEKVKVSAFVKNFISKNIKNN